MKRFLVILFLAILVISTITGCGSSQNTAPNGNAQQSSQEQAKQLTIKFATYFPPDHPQNVALREVFKKQVEEKSNGSIKVEIYDNNQLGDEKTFTEGVRMGTIEMGLPGLIQGESLPKLNILQFSYLFDSYEHAIKVLKNEEIMNKVTEGMTEMGTRPLAYSVNGFRVVSNSKHPINAIDDTKDIKLRVPQNQIFIDSLSALGFSTVTMPMTELFTALQQKTVDGQENPAVTLYTSGWYEVQPYLAITNHIFGPNIYVINEKFWQSLTPEQQQIISDAAKASADYEINLFLEQEKDILKTLNEKGIEITYPDLEPFREASQPVYEKWYKQYPDIKPIVEEIKSVK
ncbi:TRAP transporter substrate-binding protein [Calorimonas adulescens]|uniref:TRAP transporter substrate-binding protein n=1 Tax=Calorimonas adulescens TaxID=2606906 RepID=A0A5D8QGX0_9THEO|nr:TRAP transporter substrate-binding protein [Calorimonas adulescens]TZE82773.1 TRAP transporter substrate-binding protein [Calorimonas adulescens]